jgi:hypothetical protein
MAKIKKLDTVIQQIILAGISLFKSLRENTPKVLINENKNLPKRPK